MNLQSKFIAIGLLFIIHFLFGYLLSRSGKPFGGALLTAHKLASLAALILIVWAVYPVWKESGLSSLTVLAVLTTIAFFVIVIISGGWLSADTPESATIMLVHKFAPYLVLVSSVLTMFLLARSVEP